MTSAFSLPKAIRALANSTVATRRLSHLRCTKPIPSNVASRVTRSIYRFRRRAPRNWRRSAARHCPRSGVASLQRFLPCPARLLCCARRGLAAKLAILALGFDHVVARDRQRASIAHILDLIVAGRAALEHHDPAGEIEFPHPEEARVVELLDLGARLGRAVEPVAQRVGVMQ